MEHIYEKYLALKKKQNLQEQMENGGCGMENGEKRAEDAK